MVSDYCLTCHSPIESLQPLEMINRTLELHRCLHLASFSLGIFFFFLLQCSSTHSEADSLLLGLSYVIISSIKFSQPSHTLLLCPYSLKDYISFCNFKKILDVRIIISFNFVFQVPEAELEGPKNYQLN